MVRGLPADRFSEAEREAIFWGLGTHLGTAVSQNSHGEMLGHVFDQGRTYGSANTRGYQTKARLDFHTDRCDLVGLLCQRRAKQGGLSSVVSTMAVHNEILRTRPDLLPILYRGFHYSEREAADNPNGVTPRPVPVFSRQRACCPAASSATRSRPGRERRGVPLTTAEREALELMSTLSAREDMRLDMMLEPGDMQFCNNYVTTHARTGFEDWEAPAQRRLMVRLWLSFDRAGRWRPISASMTASRPASRRRRRCCGRHAPAAPRAARSAAALAPARRCRGLPGAAARASSCPSPPAAPATSPRGWWRSISRRPPARPWWWTTAPAPTA